MSKNISIKIKAKVGKKNTKIHVESSSKEGMYTTVDVIEDAVDMSRLIELLEDTVTNLKSK